jgi:hypothetical protein
MKKKKGQPPGWPKFLWERSAKKPVANYNIGSRDQLLERASSGCPFSFN